MGNRKVCIGEVLFPQIDVSKVGTTDNSKLTEFEQTLATHIWIHCDYEVTTLTAIINWNRIVVREYLYKYIIPTIFGGKFVGDVTSKCWWWSVET